MRAFTPKTLASRWNISATTVRNLCNGGDLAHFRLGNLYRIPVAAVEEHEKCQKSPSVDCAADFASHGAKTASEDVISLRHAPERRPKQKAGTNT